jgi:hypothetical protein
MYLRASATSPANYPEHRHLHLESVLSGWTWRMKVLLSWVSPTESGRVLAAVSGLGWRIVGTRAGKLSDERELRQR